ncbi:MAG TPA: hypothetical protein VK727_04125 [Steroidobacteraceae bacterium]|nr:hypothetical protein [Steroidobacteraceae bacterium]
MQPSPRLVLRTLMIAAVLATGSAQAADGDLHCTLTFQTKTWSIIYKSASGFGTIHCSNGQSLRVKLSAKGGGLTAGKSEESGHGEFSPVGHIDDLLGAYAAAQAHAGAVNSVQAQVVTKGEVSLALTGKGHGWSLGVDLSELKIER